MKQNKYDDPVFFRKYDEMPRSVHGLEAATEWPSFQALLPELTGSRVLDLGCGFGWHCRYLREQGAQHVVGVDLSENMLQRARAKTTDSEIEYKHSAIEDLRFDRSQFDLVISSLALHYLQGFAALCERVFEWLAARGHFVFSVEHPLFTSRSAQDWYSGPSGKRLHWPVDDYFDESLRRTQWLANDVVKYHRTLNSYVNGLIDAGFSIAKLEEPTVTPQVAAASAEFADERRRPVFLILSAVKDLSH